MNKLRIFVIVSIVLLTDFYVVHPSIRMTTFAMFLLVSIHLLKYGFPRLSLLAGSRLSRLLGWAFLFIVYLAVIDWVHGESGYNIFVAFFSHVLIIMLLPAFIDKNGLFTPIVWFRRCALISAFFGLVQFGGIHVTLTDLVPNFGIIGSAPMREELIDSYGRATGATYNTIGFAMDMVALFLLAYASNQLGSIALSKFQIVISIASLIFSQTRAALFGLLPGIVCAQLLFSSSLLKTAKILIPLLVISTMAIWAGYKVSEQFFPYIVKKVDQGDTHRFSTNMIMSHGILKESPWIGISANQAWDVYFQYANPSTPVHYDEEMKTPTHHNQFGYYLRYYGVIGVLFLLIVHYQAYKLISFASIQPVSVMLGALFIVNLIYSMAHNNKLMTSPLLWIFLSLVFISEKTVVSALKGKKVNI